MNAHLSTKAITKVAASTQLTCYVSHDDQLDFMAVAT
jgi:hypothetical protein